MTVPPYEPTPADFGAPAPGWGPATPPWVPAEPPAPARRSGRLVVAATVAGVLVLGGAGYAVAAFMSGGGTQPEDVLPGDTLGFVKIDLDPSAGQKMALMSLLQRFPDVDTEGDGDFRGQLLGPLFDEAGTPVDYATDVQPWLGDRMAIALVPAEESQEGVVPVVALAVEDEMRMTESLTRVQQGGGFGFALRDGYVLITDSQERADSIAADEEVLADDADFAGDREALGGDHLALAWADLSAVESLAAAQGGMGATPAGAPGALSGRVIGGVHAQDDALELVGLTFSVSDVGVPHEEPTRLVQGLPEDTLAALSVSGVGDAAVEAWEGVAQSGALDGLEEPIGDLGLELPDDLRTVFGSDLVIAAFGGVEAPAFGVRAVTGNGERATEVIDDLLWASETGISVVPAPVDDGFAVGSDEVTAQALAADDGGLGDSEAFRAAVAAPDAAGTIGYVDLARVIEQMIAQGGSTGEEAAKYAAVRALGFSATTTDEGARFVLRITTR